MVNQLSPAERSNAAVSPVTGHVLDLRSFQDIVDEARRLIPRYCPEWTDHNVSDPGITLIELFAWMTEMTLYQLNRVPETMYEHFLEMVGIQRRPPQPARVDVTFHLSAPLARPISVPSGTEVATDATDDAPARVFGTVQRLEVRPPTLFAARAWRQGTGYEDYLPYLASALVRGAIFNDVPQPGDALHLAYEGDLAGYSLQLQLACADAGAGRIDPKNPPLAWEYWSGLRGGWAPVILLDDSGIGRPRDPMAGDPTAGLSRSGTLYLHVPTDSQPHVIDGVEGTWIRVRYEEQPGQAYDRSPVLTGIQTEAIGATVEARQAAIVRNEVLGESGGEAAQWFELRDAPLLREPLPHVIEERLDGEVTEWVEVNDFSASGGTDRHFVVDYIRGRVEFGPFIREPDGGGHQYGMRPRRGATLVIPWYRSGGGAAGNVGERTISQLRTSVPYVASVTNFRPATGGRDAESLDEAKLRARAALRVGEAAVTAEDFERLVGSVDGVGRARAEAGDAPGTIRVTVVPESPPPGVPIQPEHLEPSAELIALVGSYLDEHKVLGTLIEYRPATLAYVEIDAHVYVAGGHGASEVQERVEERLRRFFHPAVGGRDGRGAPFGMTTTESQIAGIVQSVPGVSFVERVRLRDPERGDVFRAEAPPNGLLVLGRLYVLAEEE